MNGYGQHALDHLQLAPLTVHSSQCKILKVELNFPFLTLLLVNGEKILNATLRKDSWVGYIRPRYFPSFRGGRMKMGANRLDQKSDWRGGTGRLLTSKL